MVFLNGVETVALCCPHISVYLCRGFVAREIIRSSPHNVPICIIYGSLGGSRVQPGGTVPSIRNSAAAGAEIPHQIPTRVTSTAAPGSLDTGAFDTFPRLSGPLSKAVSALEM